MTAIRFHKGGSSRGPHVGHLWTDEGRLIAEVRFQRESAAGWQVAKFRKPVALAEGTTYVASVHCADGVFPFTAGYFRRAVVNGPLRALASGEAGANGVFSYSPETAFPTRTFRNANYWVDVVFRYSAKSAARARAARGPCVCRGSRDGGGLDPRGLGGQQRRIEELESRLRALEADVEALLGELGEPDESPPDSLESEW